MRHADLYKCEACGNTGELSDLYFEERDGVNYCLECNGNGEISLIADIEAHEEMVKNNKPQQFCGLCWHTTKEAKEDLHKELVTGWFYCIDCGKFLGDKLPISRAEFPTFDNANDVQMLVDKLVERAMTTQFEEYMIKKSLSGRPLATSIYQSPPEQAQLILDFIREV
jgi:hypothetical protein